MYRHKNGRGCSITPTLFGVFLYSTHFRVEFFGEHQPSSDKILLINLSNQRRRAINNLVYLPFAPQMRKSVPTSASPVWSCRRGPRAMQVKGDLKLERDSIKRELLVLGEDIPANEFERSNVLMQIVSRVNYNNLTCSSSNISFTGAHLICIYSLVNW